MVSSDILSHILPNLLLPDLIECCRVSKCWRDVAHQEIFIRTHQKLGDIVAKHKSSNRSLIEKLFWMNRKNLSVAQLFKRVKISALLSGSNKHVFADDVDLYPSLFLSLRWISLPVEALELDNLKTLTWRFTTPVFNSESKNKTYSPRFGTVSCGKPVLLAGGLPKDIKPVVVDRLISLYNVGNTVVALWNDISTVAFLVHSVSLTAQLFAGSLHLRNPPIDKACKKALELDSFGITAVVTMRNFKKILVHEIFSNLFYNEGENEISGIDESILYNLTLEKDFCLLWKTENFKGKIPHCLIVEVTLKHSKFYKPDNLWDVSKFSVSKLCNLEPISEQFYNKLSLDFAPDDCYLLKCCNEFLSVNIILSFCVLRDIYIVNKIFLKMI